MEIIKIKISPDLVVINHIEKNGTKSNEVETKDTALPAPEFQTTWNQLPTLANEICDGKLKVFKFKVTSLTFKRDKHDNLGCMMHLEVALETSQRPWHSNTPVKYQLPEGLDESPKYLSGEGIDLLNKLHTMARNYINGVKAQQDMFAQATPTKPQISQGEEAQRIIEGKPAKLRKSRKTCVDCNEPSAMVIDGVGYCQEHGQARMVPE